MPGANKVVANMYFWVGASRKASQMAIKTHMKQSHAFAKASHPWDNDTGRTESDFYSDVYKDGTNIIGDVGYLMPPSKTYSKGWWLENPNNNVKAYGRGAPFGTRFRILEKARDHNISALIARLQAIFARGGVTFGGITSDWGHE